MSKRGRLRENHGRVGERLRSDDRHHSATSQVAAPNRLNVIREAIRKRKQHKAIEPTPIITAPAPDYRMAIVAARLRAQPRPFPVGGKPPATRPQPYVLHPPLTHQGPMQR
jgi:hypothetical protein